MRLKLLKGKVTYVHRTLWSDVVSVALAKAPWQMAELSRGAKRLLAAVERQGLMRVDEEPAGLVAEDARAACKELESKLLVLGDSIHTASGAHAKALESWDGWLARTKFQRALTDAGAARRAVEAAAQRVGVKLAKRCLPWPSNLSGV